MLMANPSPSLVVSYFAIGSMMNPVSMANRGIRAIGNSQPAELLEYRLEFFSQLGFADAVRNKNSTLHGVVHKVLDSDMKLLDEIELGYGRQSATARLYDGTTIPVQVYSSLRRKPGDQSRPSERYMDVLIEGAKHHGVKESYIEWLQNHDAVPRPSCDELLTFPIPTNTPLKMVTIKDVQRNNGMEGRPFWISVNGKVLEANFPGEKAQELTAFKKRAQARGGIMELHIGKVLYDPKYGVVKTLEDVSPEYAAWCEHFVVQHFQEDEQPSYWNVVAVLSSDVK